MNKILIILGVVSTILYSQESIVINPDGSVDIKDYSLRPANYFLSNTSNLEKLDSEVYKIIKPELDKMVSDYRNEMHSKINKVKYTETIQTGSNFDEDGYLTHLLSMNNPTQFESEWLKALYTYPTYKTVGKEINKIFEINKSLWSKTVEWKDIIKFLGGYSEARKKGVSKDKASLFDVDGKLVSIELTGKNTCLAYVEIIGNKDFGLKYHLIPKLKYVYEGTYTIDNVNNYSDIYNGFNPKIHFSFEDKEYMKKIKLSRNLNDDRYSPPVESYQNLMKQMIIDFVPYDEYLKMEHMQAAIEKDKNKCSESFESFQEYCISLSKNSKNAPVSQIKRTTNFIQLFLLIIPKYQNFFTKSWSAPERFYPRLFSRLYTGLDNDDSLKYKLMYVLDCLPEEYRGWFSLDKTSKQINEAYTNYINSIMDLKNNPIYAQSPYSLNSARANMKEKSYFLFNELIPCEEIVSYKNLLSFISLNKVKKTQKWGIELQLENIEKLYNEYLFQ